MTPQQFIAQIGPGAKKSCMDTGIPASITLAQAALESGWGGSGLAMEAKNLFGIKAGPEWTGPTVTMPTEEWSQAQGWYQINAAFRAYPSWQDSLDDHAKFFFQNSNYAQALAVRANAKAWAAAIAAAGYATAPDYAQQLIQIVDQFNLYAWDVPEAAWVLVPWAQTA